MPNRIINPNNKLYKDEQLNRDYPVTDISENNIREQMPEIFNILLIDRTTSTADEINNIIWANDNYSQYNHTAYASSAQIRPELITGNMAKIIMPRALKPREQQKERTKSKAEVFTPIWVVQKQNDILDKEYANDDLDTYIKRKQLEISCGEAPYMVTRYDMNSGQMIPLQKRVGFVDRKLKRINAEINLSLDIYTRIFINDKVTTDDGKKVFIGYLLGYVLGYQFYENLKIMNFPSKKSSKAIYVTYPISNTTSFNRLFDDKKLW